MGIIQWMDGWMDGCELVGGVGSLWPKLQLL
jgi:hypothetical protein